MNIEVIKLNNNLSCHGGKYALLSCQLTGIFFFCFVSGEKPTLEGDTSGFVGTAWAPLFRAPVSWVPAEVSKKTCWCVGDLKEPTDMHLLVSVY